MTHQCFQCQEPLSAGMTLCPGCGIVFPVPVPAPSASRPVAEVYDMANKVSDVAKTTYATAHLQPAILAPPPPASVSICFLCRSPDIRRVSGIVSEGTTSGASVSRSRGNVGLYAAASRTQTKIHTKTHLAAMLGFQYPSPGCLIGFVPGGVRQWQAGRNLALQRWQNLWYCSRCDIVLDPARLWHAPPSQISALYRQ